MLRGAGVWAPAWGTFLARSLMAPAMVGVRGQDPPLQALAPADAVSALVLATSGRLQGVYNVAPDDWVGAKEAARAAGRRRLEVPQRVAQSTAERLWQAGMSAATAGELAFQTHPWVLDNARLRSGRLGAHPLQRRGVRRGGRAEARGGAGRRGPDPPQRRLPGRRRHPRPGRRRGRCPPPGQGGALGPAGDPSPGPGRRPTSPM